jgi:hypothetical protein
VPIFDLAARTGVLAGWPSLNCLSADGNPFGN